MHQKMSLSFGASLCNTIIDWAKESDTFFIFTELYDHEGHLLQPFSLDLIASKSI